MSQNKIFSFMAILGFLAGCATWLALRSGYFVIWEALPPPPQKPLELIISREFALYISTQEGQTLLWNGSAWEASDVPKDLRDGWYIFKPCIRTWPQFSPLSNPPKGIKECIQDQGTYAEFYNKHVYVLDEEGRIWQWSHLTHGLGLLLWIMIFPCIGFFVGIIFAFVISFILRRRNRRGSIQKEINPKDQAG